MYFTKVTIISHKEYEHRGHTAPKQDFRRTVTGDTVVTCDWADTIGGHTNQYYDLPYT